MKINKKYILSILIVGSLFLNIPVFAAIPWTATGTNVWSDGPVGIGTTTTPSKLSINGDLLIQPASFLWV